MIDRVTYQVSSGLLQRIDFSINNIHGVYHECKKKNRFY